MYSGFRYDPEQHAYWLDERRLPHVTQVLSMLPNGYEHAPPEVLERKRLLGRAVHKACELDDKGLLDESTVSPAIAPYLAAWRAFRAESGFTPTAIEQPGYSREYGYSGTLDRVGTLNREQALIDLKIVSKLTAVTALQTAAYAQIALETQGTEAKRRMAVQLRPDAQYRCKHYTDRADRRVFLALLQVYQWQVGRGA